MDFALNIDGNHKVNQKTHNSWTIGIYNMLGRKNPYSVYFVSENGKEYLLNKLGLGTSEKLQVARLGISNEHLNPSSPSERFIVVTCSQLLGLEYLVEKIRNA